MLMPRSSLFHSIATRCRFGTACLIKAKRLVESMVASSEMPVILPPGRARKIFGAVCAIAARGQVIAAPVRRVINSRRLILIVFPKPQRGHRSGLKQDTSGRKPKQTLASRLTLCNAGFEQPAAAVATSREGHRSPRSGRVGRHPLLGQEQQMA